MVIESIKTNRFNRSIVRDIKKSKVKYNNPIINDVRPMVNDTLIGSFVRWMSSDAKNTNDQVIGTR